MVFTFSSFVILMIRRKRSSFSLTCAKDLKETEETVVYLTDTSDLSIVGGSIIQTDIDGKVMLCFELKQKRERKSH